MRTTTAAFDTAKDKTGTKPVWLLQLDSGGSTYYYSDRAVTVDTQAYTARVLSWGRIRGVNKRMVGGGTVSDTSISLTELPSSISSQVRIGNECRIYLWFDGESLTDTLMMFKGTITDPINVTETSLAFNIKGVEDEKNKVVGELINRTEFTGASDYSVGKVKPIIYGQVYDHECLPIDAGSITTLTADITAASAADIAVTGTTSFPTSGDIWVEDEKITYTGKTSTTFTGITRGASSTTAVPHGRGAYAVESQTNYDYIIAAHACNASPTSVYINGVALSTGWSKIASGGNDLLRFTDSEAFRDALRTIVADDLDVSSTPSETTITVREVSSPASMEDTATLSYPNPKYNCTAYSDEVTFTTISGTCAFSEVTCQIKLYNAASLKIDVYINGSSTKDHTVTYLDKCDGLGGFAVTDNDIYNVSVSANADITKIKVIVGYDFPASYSSVFVGFESVGSIIRLADTPFSVSSAKDNYAYAKGSTPTATLQGAKVTCDIVGYNYSRPDEVVEHLLLNYGNAIVAGDLDTTVTANTNYATNYPLGFALTKPHDLMSLCRQLAYQVHSRFFWDSGKVYLTKIPEGTPAADKSLVADDIVFNSMAMAWTPNNDIMNSFDAPYDLRGREYYEIESDSDSASISAYGTRDGSHKLKLNLVNNSTTAANVVDDFILKMKEPKRVAIFTTPLQNCELQRGDIVAITHNIDGGWTTKPFEIMETSVTIGNTRTPDSITFKTEEI